jgi:nucleoside-diphosphate-sugar epimerase
MKHAVRREDLDHIVHRTEQLWRELSGERLFITGGTGFFGKWVLESLLHANRSLGVQVSALVLTRNADGFSREMPGLASNPAITLHGGDLTDFTFPDGTFSHVLHMGTTSSTATFNNEEPLAKFANIAHGTERALEFAVRGRAVRFLHTSSGAVYGRQPDDIAFLPEEFSVAPDPTVTAAAVGHSKRVAEFLTAAYAEKYGIQATNARCFSFIGPHLPLDIHYAAGNFIRDALAGGPIVVRGDGAPQRSYLYAADLVIWLLTIMVRGTPGRVYNVGSEEDVTIGELAHRVARLAPVPVQVTIAGSSPASPLRDRYVPSTARARRELGLETLISLDDAIARTFRSLQPQ